MFKNQIRSVLTLVLVIALVIPFFTTSVSAAYENTYYNTGNMRDDIIGVALTQVGYSEGYGGYTKYGDWYGYPYLDWCGMFVSWCANEADIPNSILNKTGIADPDCFGLSYMDGYNYTPIKGDLFFKKDFSHVGLVYYTDGDYFYTIEGNTSDVGWEGTSVLIQCRRISDCYFSSPDYSGSYTDDGDYGGDDEDIDYGCDHDYVTEIEDSHPHDEYEVCTICGDSYYTGNEGFSDDCIECIQSVCDHEFGNWETNGDGTHSRFCSDCDFEESDSHNWVVGSVLKEATCVEEGTEQIICSVCNVESTRTIDATNEHNYGSFSFINEAEHQTVCSGCSEQIISVHSLSNDWKYNNLYHWSSCADCNGRIGHSEHNFSNGCTEPCVDCGYTSTSGHKSDGVKISDETHHWENCIKCGQQVNLSAHTYTSDCDDVCNDCGYKRIPVVNHNFTIKANESGHWEICSACNYTTGIESHTVDGEAQDWENEVCSVCEYILRSADAHIHTYEHLTADANAHWGTCACGEEMEAEVHVWNFNTNSCSVCGTLNAPAEEPAPNFFVAFFRNLFKI